MRKQIRVSFDKSDAHNTVWFSTWTLNLLLLLLFWFQLSFLGVTYSMKGLWKDEEKEAEEYYKQHPELLGLDAHDDNKH